MRKIPLKCQSNQITDSHSQSSHHCLFSKQLFSVNCSSNYYWFSLHNRPSFAPLLIFIIFFLPFRSVSVQGVGLSVTDLSQQENDRSTYSFSWSSIKITANKKKDRTTVQLLFQFQDGLTLVLPLQVKFYQQDQSDHLTWGIPLNHIEYDCTVKPGATYVDIVKETFR